MVHIGNDWDKILADEFNKEYYRNLRIFLKEEYSKHTVYPEMYDIFNALKLTAYSDVNAVILGQDPYHEPYQAHGLCFSVQKGVRKPPSLVNIFKELEADIGIRQPDHGCLTDWAESGVLLLNTVLTVRKGNANSHEGRGWEIFTDKIISILNERDDPVVFILWGANAQKKTELITNPQHLILKGAHPSPLSVHRGFWGGRYFSKTNRFLIRYGRYIDWTISDM